MKVAKRLLALLFLSIPIFANASTTTVYQVDCESCISTSALASMARSYGSTIGSVLPSTRPGSASGTVYVFNYSEGLSAKYLVTAEREDTTGSPLEIFTSLESMTSAQTESFEKASDTYNTMSSLLSSVEIPSSVANSGYELVGAQYKVNKVGDYIFSNSTNAQRIETSAANLTNYLLSVVGSGSLPDNFGLEATAVFPDGSTVTLAVVSLSATSIEFKFVRGRDADDNTISATASDYLSGSYSFASSGSTGVQEYIDAAARLGITITDDGTSTGTTMTCTTDNICTVTTQK
ncbi:hypothetical protein [Gallaecimonas mangrovi]|uniref:hypothetical protein n=1 Tax=Gallaecimonas mangrovi TaxID=2291597 RepID=UPI0012600E8A|nr:hypothetical protein [Gallaecimonas mangrovi]